MSVRYAARERNAQAILDALRRLDDDRPGEWWPAISVWLVVTGTTTPSLSIGSVTYELGRLPGVERRRPEPRDFTVYRLRRST